MRKFNVVVNGTAYDVEVEETGAGAPAVAAAPVVVAAPVAAAAPKAAAPKAAAPKAAVAPAGATTITAPMPGTILSVNVTVGQEIKKGAVVAILEAMKMENEIMAPADGKVVAVSVAKGATVNSGDALVAIQ